MPADQPLPSDQAPPVLAVGDGGVTGAVLSLSERHPDGEDARYLAWHLLDHLPEQYRIPAIRLGQRWVSTARCRAARLASEDPFDRVDHVVGYLLTEPAGPSLDAFFDLGGRLRSAGRMPLALPRVHVGVWEVVEKVANPAVLAGADVVPWRPGRGLYLVIEQCPGGKDDPARSERAAAIAAIDGVAGAWRFRGTSGRHARAQDCGDHEALLCYLEADPVVAAPAIAAVLTSHSGPRESLLLAGPFEPVVPFDWSGALPGP